MLNNVDNCSQNVPRYIHDPVLTFQYGSFQHINNYELMWINVYHHSERQFVIAHT
jgi:hypothetical protein